MAEHGQQTGIKVDASRGMAKLADVLAIVSGRTVLETIGQRLLNWTVLNIQKAGTEAPWQRMAAITLARRPLRPSDRHFSSPYQTLLQQSPVSKVISDNAVQVGTEAKYAVFHHFGGGRLPSRPLVPSKERARMLALDVLNAIAAQVRAKGLAR